MPKRTESEDSAERFEEVPAEQAPEPAPQLRPAPSRDEVQAYWASGRAKDEAERMMESHRAKCAVNDCETEFYYIPQPGDEAALTDLLCSEHSKQLTK